MRNFFRSLHWKLTLSYTLVTIAALLVVQMLAVLLVWVIVTNSNLYQRALIAVVREDLAPRIAVYLDEPEPNVQGLAGWLSAAETSAGLTLQSLNFPVAQISLSDFDENTNLLVLDKDLVLLAGIPASIADQYQSILEPSDAILAAALAGKNDPDQIAQIVPTQGLMVAVPVFNQRQEVSGIIVLRTAYPPTGILIGMLSYVAGSLIFFTIAAGLVGALFGFITSRGLTRRLDRVTQATHRWSQGDFSTFIQDHSRDELGQLAQRLNRMAEELQNLLRTRQDLAAMEERNRLARDLHDGVKQQVFAAAMQIGAARAMMDKDASAASKHLDEAERLARQSSSELTAIIRELHPATLQAKGLAPAINELVGDWSRLNKVKVEVEISEHGRLPKKIEQTIFRLVQEALSNIARHSQATQARLELSVDQNEVSLVVSDNGKGFDVLEAQGKGLGLRSMRERIQASGGEFRVESNPGRGTRLIFRCKIDKG